MSEQDRNLSAVLKEKVIVAKLRNLQNPDFCRPPPAGCEHRQSAIHYVRVTVLADFFRHTHSQSWGRTGFDGDMKAVVARRVALTRKTGALRNLPADNNGYALAA